MNGQGEQATEKPCRCGRGPCRPGQRNCRLCRNEATARSRPDVHDLTPDQYARYLARKRAAMAERRGTLTRKPCEYGLRPGETEGLSRPMTACGLLEVERHHDDYDKPLEVRYLCKPHHVLADRARKPTQRALALV